MTTRTHHVITCTLLWASSLVGSARAADPAPVVHVPADFASIQAGIDAVDPGGTVIVAPGVYHELVDLDNKLLTLRSADPSDAATVASTIIDATGLDGSAATCSGGPETVMDGLTLRGGTGTPVLIQPEFGTVVHFGGGLYLAGSPTVRRCIIRDNEALQGSGFPPPGGVGGGIYVDSGSPSFRSCVVYANRASHGGGLYVERGSPTFTNSLFASNDSHAVFAQVFSASIELTNCTFTDNVGGVQLRAQVSALTNSILWGNGSEISGLLSNITVAYCDIAGGWPGAGNIDANPMLDGFRLQPGSPCIDAANNAAVPAGTTTDLAGDPRFVDDPDSVDSGLGDPPLVDMGAYEFQAAECLLIIGDGPGASRFRGLGHIFGTQVSGVVDSYAVLMEDIPSFVLPTGPPLQSRPTRGPAGASPDADSQVPRWMADGVFAVEILFWNPSVFPEQPEGHSFGLMVQVTPDGSVITRPYGNGTGIEIWAETGINAHGQAVVRFPFTIPGL